MLFHGSQIIKTVINIGHPLLSWHSITKFKPKAKYFIKFSMTPVNYKFSWATCSNSRTLERWTQSCRKPRHRFSVHVVFHVVLSQWLSQLSSLPPPPPPGPLSLSLSLSFFVYAKRDVDKMCLVFTNREGLLSLAIRFSLKVLLTDSNICLVKLHPRKKLSPRKIHDCQNTKLKKENLCLLYIRIAIKERCNLWLKSAVFWKLSNFVTPRSTQKKAPPQYSLSSG